MDHWHVHVHQPIWRGLIEWTAKRSPDNPETLTKYVRFEASTNPEEGELVMDADSWPRILTMELMPKRVIENMGRIYLKNSKYVFFHPLRCEALESLTKVMRAGLVGCVQFLDMSPTSKCDTKVLILLFSVKKNAYLGFVPNDQIGFLNRLRHVEAKQALRRNRQPVREHQTIWHGVLEWLEKPDGPQNLTRPILCQVLTNSDYGAPDLKAGSWPQKLIVQLMPKQLIGDIGGSYLLNSKSVLFHPQQCEALDSLTKVMSSGFVGCVHFTQTSGCDIKVLILLYSAEKCAYLGFIPNNQITFMDRLHHVIQQSKSRQGQGQDQQLLPAQQEQQQSPGGAVPGGQVLGGPGPQQLPHDNYKVAWQQSLVIQQLCEILYAEQQQELQCKSQIETDDTEDVHHNDEDSSYFMVEEDVHPSTSHEKTPKKINKNKKSSPDQMERDTRAEETYNILKMLTARDECSVYGEYIGNELRKFPPTTQTYVKHIFANILLKAALGECESHPRSAVNVNNSGSNAEIQSSGSEVKINLPSEGTVHNFGTK